MLLLCAIDDNYDYVTVHIGRVSLCDTLDWVVLACMGLVGSDSDWIELNRVSDKPHDEAGVICHMVECVKVGWNRIVCVIADRHEYETIIWRVYSIHVSYPVSQQTCHGRRCVGRSGFEVI